MMNYCTPVSWYAILAAAATARYVMIRINTKAKRELKPA